MSKKATVRHVITDEFIISLLKKENPFTEGTVQYKHAAAVMSCKGKTVADAKKKGADSWTVRELVARKVISVKKPVADKKAAA